MLPFVSNIMKRTSRLLSSPMEELNDRQKSMRNALELAQYSMRTLKQHRAAQMAAALTYRTIFSLVPFLIVALFVIRATGGFDSFGGQLQEQAYRFFGVYDLLYSDSNDAAMELSQRIDGVIEDISTRMADVSFESIGAVGLVVLIWAALALVITLEDCFNSIYGAPSGRSWHLRIAIYWAAITLGPLLMLVSLAITSGVGERLSNLPGVGPVIGFLDSFAALAVSWLALFAVYSLLPNAKVRRRPAMIGALVAAMMWELGKWGFTMYVGRVVPGTQLYGSLALIPLFMFWVYMNWLLVLFGLEITYTMQTLPDFQRRKRQAEEDKRLTGDPMWLIPLTTSIGEAFIAGRSAGRQETAERLRLPLSVVDDMANLLETTGLIHKVTGRGSDISYTLARPPETISMEELLTLVDKLQLGEKDKRTGAGWAYLNRLAEEQHKLAKETTLKDVIADDRVVLVPVRNS